MVNNLNKILSNPYATTLVAVLHTEDTHVCSYIFILPRVRTVTRSYVVSDSALSVAI